MKNLKKRPCLGFGSTAHCANIPKRISDKSCWSRFVSILIMAQLNIFFTGIALATEEPSRLNYDRGFLMGFQYNIYRQKNFNDDNVTDYPDLSFGLLLGYQFNNIAGIQFTVKSETGSGLGEVNALITSAFYFDFKRFGINESGNARYVLKAGLSRNKLLFNREQDNVAGLLISNGVAHIADNGFILELTSDYTFTEQGTFGGFTLTLGYRF